MRIIALAALVLVLTACYPNDPYALQALAQSQIKATMQAEIQAEKDYQLAQASTRQASEAEIAVIIARLDATETTWGILQAQGGATATADAATATAPAIQATQTMIVANLVAQQTETVAGLKFAQAKADILPSGMFVITLFLCGLLGWAFVKLFNVMVDGKDNKLRLVETRAGTVVWNDGPRLMVNYDRERIGVVYGTDAQLSEEAEPVVSIEPPPDISDALELVQAAIEVEGENGDYIPSRLPGWSGYRWQKVIAKLAYVGIVAGSGHRSLLGGRKLKDVQYDLTTGRLTI